MQENLDVGVQETDQEPLSIYGDEDLSKYLATENKYMDEECLDENIVKNNMHNKSGEKLVKTEQCIRPKTVPEAQGRKSVRFVDERVIHSNIRSAGTKRSNVIACECVGSICPLNQNSNEAKSGGNIDRNNEGQVLDITEETIEKLCEKIIKEAEEEENARRKKVKRMCQDVKLEVREPKPDDDSDDYNGKNNSHNKTEHKEQNESHSTMGGGKNNGYSGDSSENATEPLDMEAFEGNCNNNSNRTDDVEEELDNMNKDNKKVTKRKKQTGQRPKSKLGFWEDPSKPDPDFELEIVGVDGRQSPPKEQKQVTRPVSAKVSVENKTVRSATVRQRPSSAGPRQFMAEEKRKQQRIPRPPPAQYKLIASKDSTEIQDISYNNYIPDPFSDPFASIESVKQHDGLKGKRLVGGRPRPLSAKLSSGMAMKGSKSDTDLFTLEGNKMSKASREEKEVYDVKALQKGLYRPSSAKRKPVKFSEGQKLAADVDELENWLGSVQTEVQSCIKKSQVAKTEDFESEMIKDFKADCKISSSDRSNTSNLNEAVEEDNNCTQDSTSSAAREEVKSEILHAQEKHEQVEMEPKVKSEEELVFDQLTEKKNEVMNENLTPGLISSELVEELYPGKHAYEMVVYHYEEKVLPKRLRPSSASKKIKMRPSSAKKILQNPSGDGDDVGDTDKVFDIQNTDIEGYTGEISSYNVTMMGEGDQSFPREVEDEEAFLKMVLDHLPKPEAKTKKQGQVGYLFQLFFLM